MSKSQACWCTLCNSSTSEAETGSLGRQPCLFGKVQALFGNKLDVRCAAPSVVVLVSRGTHIYCTCIHSDVHVHTDTHVKIKNKAESAAEKKKGDTIT